MDFKEFCKTNESMKNFSINDQDSINSRKSEDDIKNTSEINSQKIEDVLNKYSSYNESELMEEFLKESAKAKKSGIYSEENINNIKSTIFPYLTEEQKEYFDKLMNMVK